MIFNEIFKFLGILILGVISGLMFGFAFAICVIASIKFPEFLIVFGIIVSPLYSVSVWRQLKKRNYLVIVRRFIEIILLALALNAMFLLEEGMFQFDYLVWKVIYISVVLLTIPITSYFVLETYFQNSWLFKEINHIVEGMQFYGLLPKSQEKEIKEE